MRTPSQDSARAADQVARADLGPGRAPQPETATCDI